MIILPNVHAYEPVLKPDPPTGEIMPIYIALKRGMKLFGEQEFTCTIPPDHERDHSVLHMSSIGYCGRRQWLSLRDYNLYQELEEKNAQLAAPYLHFGNLVEAYTVHILTLGGISPFGTQEELIDFQGKITGHIDGIVTVSEKNHLLEIKGLKHSSVENLIRFKLREALPNYFDQMQYYMFCLKLDSGYFLALDKDTSMYYIEYINRDDERIRFLRSKVLGITGLPSFEDIPEKFIHRDCRFCPLKEICSPFDGKQGFIDKFVEYQKTRQC